MIQQINVRDYGQFTIHQLLQEISKEFHEGIKETIATVHLNLETAHILESNEAELEAVRANLKIVEERFLEHISKEEQMLFPNLSIEKKRLQSKETKFDFRKLINSLQVENNLLKSKIEKLSKLTRHFECEPAHSPSHKLAYARLKDLEQDLNKMFFVEENFLFPRALKILGVE